MVEIITKDPIINNGTTTGEGKGPLVAKLLFNYAAERKPGGRELVKANVVKLVASFDLSKRQQEALSRIACSPPMTVNQTIKETLSGMSDPRRYLEVLADYGLVAWTGIDLSSFDVLWLSRLGIILSLLNGTKFSKIQENRQWAFKDDDPTFESLKKFSTKKWLPIGAKKILASAVEKHPSILDLVELDIEKPYEKIDLLLSKKFEGYYNEIKSKDVKDVNKRHFRAIRPLNDVQTRIISTLAISGPSSIHGLEVNINKSKRVDPSYFNRVVEELLLKGLVESKRTNDKSGSEKKVLWLTYLGGLQAICITPKGHEKLAENILGHSAELEKCDKKDPKMDQWKMLKDIAKETGDILSKQYASLSSTQETQVEVEPPEKMIFDQIQLLNETDNIYYSEYLLEDKLSIRARPSPYVVFKVNGGSLMTSIIGTEYMFKALPEYEFGSTKPTLDASLLSYGENSRELGFETKREVTNTYYVDSSPSMKVRCKLERVLRLEKRPVYRFEFSSQAYFENEANFERQIR